MATIADKVYVTKSCGNAIYGLPPMHFVKKLLYTEIVSSTYIRGLCLEYHEKSYPNNKW